MPPTKKPRVAMSNSASGARCWIRASRKNWRIGLSIVAAADDKGRRAQFLRAPLLQDDQPQRGTFLAGRGERIGHLEVCAQVATRGLGLIARRMRMPITENRSLITVQVGDTSK